MKESKELEDLMIIVKSEINIYVKVKMLQNNPELSSLITRKQILDSLIFIEGFSSCLKEFIEPPYDRERIQEFLKNEAYNFILNRIS
jgi:hypothetical protein